MSEHYNTSQLSLLTRKQVYPYDYMDSWDRFKETSLPPTTDFYNILTDSHITAEDYAQAQKVWATFKMNNLGEYHDLYLKTDVLLLADVFEKFRDTALQHYGLDPVHYITLPSFALDAMLKKTDVQLELLSDPDMYKFFEDGIRGGISVVSHRHLEANNPHVEGYNPKKPDVSLVHVDVNNLYGKAMCEPLPCGGFEWMTNLENLDVNTLGSGDRGCVLEVDLEYPQHLHHLHNGYPLAPEQVTVTEDMLSPYAQKHKPPHYKPTPKLVPNLMHKTRYILHHKNLQLYLKQLKFTGVFHSHKIRG